MDLFDIVAARIGGGSGGGTPQVQSDWNQNDSSKKGYIKNRTHWKEEFERDYTVLPNIEPDPTIGFIEYGKKIGLEIGKEYTLEAHLKDGTIQTIQATAIEFPGDIGITGVPCIMVENICQIIDGVVFDLVAEIITAGDNCYYQFDSRVVDYVEKGIIKNLPSVEIVIHKIPNEFIDFPEPEVDQIFDSRSENAQSGIAVEQAIGAYNESLLVDSANIADKAITNNKVADKAITNNKIANSVIDFSKVWIGKRVLANSDVSGISTFSYTVSEFSSELLFYVENLRLDMSDIPSDIDTITAVIILGLQQHTLSLSKEFLGRGGSLKASMKSKRVETVAGLRNDLQEHCIHMFGTSIYNSEYISTNLGGYNVGMYFYHYTDGTEVPIPFSGTFDVFNVPYKEG